MRYDHMLCIYIFFIVKDGLRPKTIKKRLNILICIFYGVYELNLSKFYKYTNKDISNNFYFYFLIFFLLEPKIRTLSTL